MNHLEKIKNKKILITGGLGFVGNNLVKMLLNQYNCNVIVVDDCSNSKPDVLGKLIKEVEFHQISVLDSEKLFKLFKGVNYVFHLACKQISEAGKEPFMDLKVNSGSTLAILEYLRNNRMPEFERFIYTSSCSVYGSYKHLPASEDGITYVMSNYAATKLLGENYTIIYNNQYDVATTSVRYSNIYGKGQTPDNPYCGVLGKFIHNAITNKPLQIFGDGEQTRDYTYVDDAVSATILSGVHPRALGEVLNIGTSIETSVNQLAEMIHAHIGDIRMQHIPERDIDNIRRRAVDIEKIHRLLNWAPNYNLQMGIPITIEWYKAFIKSK